VAEEHTCGVCGATVKTKGALTQHMNREHADDPLAKLSAAIPGSPRPGGVFDSRPLRAMPSGVPAVDYAIGIGGVPRGAVVEIFGPSQTGKTGLALTFSAHAQQQGGKAGFMDAERALQTTFMDLFPGLDQQALLYSTPPDWRELGDDGDYRYPEAVRKQMAKDGWDGSGEAALEATRQFIKTGAVDIWTVDSVHALSPRAALGAPIGSPAAQAAIARLMSGALQVIEPEISNTRTTLVFVNHVKDVPNAKFGRNWSKPGGSATDYYAAIQLHVTAGMPYYRVGGDTRKIGHVVKVKVHKSKVNAPHASAEFDLFYGEGVAKPADETKGVKRYVTPGVDVMSSWLSVATESGVLKNSGGVFSWGESGERVGGRGDVMEALLDDGSDLRKALDDVVYPEQYRRAAA
jgi:recombination protein RecA